MSPISRENSKILNYILILFIIFFSFTINWNYSKFGLFPIDTFLHYDSSYRILQGEYPVKDYWIVSGFFVDFVQAFFFKIFDVNWKAYIFHSSIFNVLISLFTFFTLKKLGVEKLYAFIFTLSFATLAYPVSGTPFVDMHATYLCLMATYCIFLAVKQSRKYFFWILTLIFFFISFLSKQVPASYLMILYLPIVLLYLINTRSIKTVKVAAVASLSLLILFYLFLRFLKIDLNLFFIQYVFSPQGVGSERFTNLNFSATSLFNHYKFILIPIILIFLLELNHLKKKRINLFSTETINLVILILMCFGMIFHQSLTKNQIYIYFLVPVCFSFLFIRIEKSDISLKKYIKLFVVFSLIIITFKYHMRFNENRKFHELNDINFSKAIESVKLDKSLKGLLWISLLYKENPNDEIIILKEIISELDKKKKPIMLITHYSFLDSITSKKLNSPSRTHTMNGASIPTKKDKYFEDYKNFLKEKLNKKKIDEIYFLKFEKLSTSVISEFINEKCYKKEQDSLFVKFKIKIDCLN